ncbi:MAG TPA: Mur ligase family protein, partial [Casimicrobiaceae bacterium]
MGHRLSAYRDALDYLFVRTTGQWRFGLERTQALLAELGNPQDKLRMVHVGGTNGKGSVCAMLEGALRDRRFRVAKYTSPHLVDFRERFIIDGTPVSEESVVDFIREWTPAVERIGASFFEATTAMAFSLFARAEPDVAIVEVGLGGRLDSTNVIDPMLAIVTNIGIDHTEYLGDTRAQIAAEKAGIFKRGRAAVIGERDRTIADLLVARAREAGSSPVELVSEPWRMKNGLVGEHQTMNAAVALRALELLPPPFMTPRAVAAQSLEDVRLAGRFDQRGSRIFDVAHNRD